MAGHNYRLMGNVRAAAFGHCRGIVRICVCSVIFRHKERQYQFKRD